MVAASANGAGSNSYAPSSARPTRSSAYFSAGNLCRGGSGIAYLLYYYTMSSVGAVRATGVTFLVPVTAVFWGVVLLGESLTLPTLIGMLVILAGIVLTNLRRAPRPQAAVERDSAAA